MTYMDLLEKKLVEIIQFYSDPLKEEEAKNENEEEELKNAALLEKIISKYINLLTTISSLIN